MVMLFNFLSLSSLICGKKKKDDNEEEEEDNA